MNKRLKHIVLLSLFLSPLLFLANGSVPDSLLNILKTEKESCPIPCPKDSLIANERMQLVVALQNNGNFEASLFYLQKALSTCENNYYQIQKKDAQSDFWIYKTVSVFDYFRHYAIQTGNDHIVDDVFKRIAGKFTEIKCQKGIALISGIYADMLVLHSADF